MKNLEVQLTLLDISNEDDQNFKVQISIAPLLKYQKIKIKNYTHFFYWEKNYTH